MTRPTFSVLAVATLVAVLAIASGVHGDEHQDPVRRRIAGMVPESPSMSYSCDTKPIMIPADLPVKLNVEIEFPNNFRSYKFAVTYNTNQAEKGSLFNNIYAFNWPLGDTTTHRFRVVLTNAESGAQFTSDFSIPVADQTQRSQKFALSPIPKLNTGEPLVVSWSIITDRMPWFFYQFKPTISLDFQLKNPGPSSLEVMHENCLIGEGEKYDLLLQASREASATSSWDKNSDDESDSTDENGFTAYDRHAALQTRGIWDSIKSGWNSFTNGVSKTVKGCFLFKSIELPARFGVSLFVDNQKIGLKFNNAVEIRTKLLAADINAKLRGVFWDFAGAKVVIEGEGFVGKVLSGLGGFIFNNFIAKGMLPPAFLQKGYSPQSDPAFTKNIAILRKNLGEKAPANEQVKVIYDLFERGISREVAESVISTTNMPVSSPGGKLANSFKKLFSTAESTLEFRLGMTLFEDRQTCFMIESLRPPRQITLQPREKLGFVVQLTVPKVTDGPIEAINILRISMISIELPVGGLFIPGKVPGFDTENMVVQSYVIYPDPGNDQFEKGSAVLSLRGKPQVKFTNAPLNLGFLWAMIATVRNINNEANERHLFAAPTADESNLRADCGGLLGNMLDSVMRTRDSDTSRDSAGRQAALALESVDGFFDDDCVSPSGHLHAKINGYIYENPDPMYTHFTGCSTPRTSKDDLHHFPFPRLADADIPPVSEFMLKKACGTREFYLGDYLGRTHRVVPVTRIFSSESSGIDAQTFIFEVYMDTGVDTKKIIAYAIRGSDSSNDWCMNFQMTKISPSTISNKPLPGKVHTGMWTYWASVRDRVIATLREYVNKGFKLSVSGHSLGAGAATLASYDLAISIFGNAVPENRLEVHLYGTPRVGSREFVDAYDAYIGRFAHNYHNKFLGCLAGMPVIGRDVVTSVPPNSFGFYDIGTLSGKATPKARLCHLRCPLTCPGQNRCNENCPYTNSLAYCHATREYGDAFVAMYEYTKARGNVDTWRAALRAWNSRRVKNEVCQLSKSTADIETVCKK